MLSLSVKLRLNLNQSQFWGIFCTQKNQNSNFLKMFQPFLSLYAAINSCKKIKKFNALITYETQKTYFANFVQKSSAGFFPKKSFESILKLYAAVTSNQFHALIFY